MRSRTPAELTDAPGTLRYEWRRKGSWEFVAATAIGMPLLPEVGSEAQFITEHYWGYTSQRNGATIEYEVSHPPWRVWHAQEPQLNAEAATLYGPAFAEPLTSPPRSAFIADGSPIVVYRPLLLP
jgi:hypothetical protein